MDLVTQDERRIAAHLLKQIGQGLRPDAEAAKAAHVLLTDLVNHVHGASSHTPRRKRPRGPVPIEVAGEEA